jgi:hypothetical protein
MIETRDHVKELRKFAVTLFSAMGVLGAFFIWQERDIGFVLWGIGSVALLAAWVCPMGLKPVYTYWMKLAIVLGFISSHVILALVYYLVLTPMGLVMRVLGKNPMPLQPDENTQSYWIKKHRGKYDRQRYEKMY